MYDRTWLILACRASPYRWLKGVCWNPVIANGSLEIRRSCAVCEDFRFNFGNDSLLASDCIERMCRIGIRRFGVFASGDSGCSSSGFEGMLRMSKKKLLKPLGFRLDGGVSTRFISVGKKLNAFGPTPGAFMNLSPLGDLYIGFGPASRFDAVFEDAASTRNCRAASEPTPCTGVGSGRFTGPDMGDFGSLYL